MARFNLRRKLQRRISILKRCILRVWNHILTCSLGKPSHNYRMVPPQSLPVSTLPEIASSGYVSGIVTPSAHPPMKMAAAAAMYHDQRDIDSINNKDSDLVALKISLLGDCQIGKTSFLVIN